ATSVKGLSMDRLPFPRASAVSADGMASESRLCSADPAAFKRATAESMAAAIRAHSIDLWSPCTPLEVLPGRERVSDAARFGSTRRCVFEDCLWPNAGQISFSAVAPCSHLNC